MGVEKLLILGTVVLLVIGLGCICLAQYFNNRGKKVWSEKKEKINMIDRISYNWSVFLEGITVQIDRETEEKIKKHLVEVFDHIVKRNPDMQAANDYLEIETYMKITGFWDGPYGRILELEIKSEDKPSVKIKFNINSIMNAAYRTRKEQEKPKLRVIK
ncbi:hypothetical protein [Caldisalinibacter kiritimatiensis]|uniref:Lipoprotein n=1 Tax=Caldisalinibacter kiritimatiensis TaxID=1304284 RepID=R1AWA4_9FIRM|nr:hypothetical protein [Caldisalinibacter kiritimatiensis]EOD01443.1 hypothetical protein L21TH_0490 [Caldisalinibacter kiritimatiensis]